MPKRPMTLPPPEGHDLCVFGNCDKTRRDGSLYCGPYHRLGLPLIVWPAVFWIVILLIMKWKNVL
jgi:hypothetical protein